MINGMYLPEKLQEIILNDEDEQLKQYLSTQEISNNDLIEYVKYAASNNSFNCVQTFLDNQYNINKRDKLGQNLIHLASGLGNSNLLELLLQHLKKSAPDSFSKIINAQDKNLQTPLMLLAQKGHMHTLNQFFALAKEEILIDKYDKYGNTALHHATINNHPLALKALILNNANVHLQNMELETIIDLSNENCKTTIAKAILEKNYPLHFAAKMGNLPRLRKALTNNESMIELDDEGNTLLHCAAASGQIDIVKFLIEQAKLPANSHNFHGLSAGNLAYHHQHSQVSNYLNRHYYRDMLYNAATTMAGHPLSQSAINAIVFGTVSSLFSSWCIARKNAQRTSTVSEMANALKEIDTSSAPTEINISTGTELVTKIGMDVGTQVVISALTARMSGCNIQ